MAIRRRKDREIAYPLRGNGKRIAIDVKFTVQELPSRGIGNPRGRAIMAPVTAAGGLGAAKASSAIANPAIVLSSMMHKCLLRPLPQSRDLD
jgi:hypothetical protein